MFWCYSCAPSTGVDYLRASFRPSAHKLAHHGAPCATAACRLWAVHHPRHRCAQVLYMALGWAITEYSIGQAYVQCVMGLLQRHAPCTHMRWMYAVNVDSLVPKNVCLGAKAARSVPANNRVDALNSEPRERQHVERNKWCNVLLGRQKIRGVVCADVQRVQARQGAGYCARCHLLD